MRILVPVGTRPEIVKLAPVVSALRAAGLDTQVVATGQQHDPALTDAFFDELALRPDVRWRVDGTEAERTGALLTKTYEHLERDRPDVILLLGDTYTVPVFCVASRRFAIPVVHVEAGLRSFNTTSVEEANRRIAGVIAALHLVPTEQAGRFLLEEGVEPERIRIVGNPIVDVLCRAGVSRRPPARREGVLVTAHRATNVDHPERLGAIVSLVRELAVQVGPVTFPLHPRTRSRLDEAGAMAALKVPGVDVCEPLPWRTTLEAIAASKVVVTDSGGLQEEASFFGVPVVVLRTSTPRWEGVASGAAVLAGVDVDRALRAAEELTTPGAQARVAAQPCFYGDGQTSERIAAILADPAIGALLTMSEPDFRDKPPPC